MNGMNSFEEEVKQGERFEFGKNWKSFLNTINDFRIKEAEKSILEMLKINNLKGKTLLDIGSGSGLFSLAARNLGALVHSFDYDPKSVACTLSLRERYFKKDSKWDIETGSILDNSYLKTLGSFDVVYSWGVLHHTGNMWLALENTLSLVNANGYLFIALYNDQGIKSKIWWRVKKIYCSGIFGKGLIISIFSPLFFIKTTISCIAKHKNIFSDYKKKRGMSIIHDWFDWLGGFPFEVAKVEDIFNFFEKHKFILKNIKTTNGLGINQFVFKKIK